MQDRMCSHCYRNQCDGKYHNKLFYIPNNCTFIDKREPRTLITSDVTKLIVAITDRLTDAGFIKGSNVINIFGKIEDNEMEISLNSFIFGKDRIEFISDPYTFTKHLIIHRKDYNKELSKKIVADVLYFFGREHEKPIIDDIHKCSICLEDIVIFELHPCEHMETCIECSQLYSHVCRDCGGERKNYRLIQ